MVPEIPSPTSVRQPHPKATLAALEKQVGITSVGVPSLLASSSSPIPVLNGQNLRGRLWQLLEDGGAVHGRH